MQQPDYNNSSSSEYYNYPNPNPNYASAPPFNHPSSNPTPLFNNPNPNSPPFTNYQPNTLQNPPIYPQLPPIHPQFDHFPTGYFNSQPNSVPTYDNYGKSRVDSVDYGKSRVDSVDYGNSRVESANNANYGNNRPESENYGNYSSSHVNSELGFGGYNNSQVNSGTNYSNYPSFTENPRSRADLNMEFSNLGLNSSSGIYPYTGANKPEPYGSRGTGPKSWVNETGPSRFNNGPLLGQGDSGPVKFDDFGRPIGDNKGLGGSNVKIVRAVPKAESVQDEKGGVQKFRVKLLAETGGQSTMDVLCQIGLDGIRMLDPPTSRTLRIYPLETVTRFEVLDSSIFAFWAKTPVDIEPRRIRLKSNSYTSSTILDIVTAATIQFKEIGGSSRPSDSLKPAEQPTEKKKGLGDWINLMKPGNEEKDHWVPDEAVAKCTSCAADFGAFVRRHHCRNCGDIFCDKCTHGRIALTAEENAQPVRVCDRCLAEVTHRLNISKESSNRSSSGLQSHEDLAKKLQEEMERNRRASSGSRSDGSGRRMKEVACPTCTVHLQVQVPSSGSETIECGVCQNPFLVSSH